MGAFYSLFRELTKVGIPPPMARKMEVWEAAAALGVGTKVTERQAAHGLQTTSSIPESELALLRARVAYERGEGPKPEARATDPAEIAAMMNAIS